MNLSWIKIGIHYHCNMHIFRVLVLQQKYPEDFPKDYVDRVIKESYRDIQESHLPKWIERLIERVTWHVMPMIAPFGTVL
ncbi:MAG: hypothetical protein A2514_11235 [Gammaproteobacteria bacterium RIFOXYD12_FULL_61_37]|nr:MAG: hypothetical protein A2514_11235 [Gammaproteobacteria bacterium RIFOXYD12_FULL_61_37]